MAAAGQFRGVLTLRGRFLSAHRDDIEHLLKNEAARAGVDNPLGRVTRWDRSAPERLVLMTTTEHLAKRLGQALRKAFDGTVRYRFSHETKFGSVTWTRD
jgi:hypothetical protein